MTLKDEETESNLLIEILMNESIEHRKHMKLTFECLFKLFNRFFNSAVLIVGILCLIKGDFYALNVEK